MLRLPALCCLVLLSLTSRSANAHDAAGFDDRELQDFIRSMGERHGFDDARLHEIFSLARLDPSILEAIAKPAEGKPWREYRPIFLNPERISAGVGFWSANVSRLQAAWSLYGVDPAIVVAIIGVETFYGRHSGRYRVIDALATLAFNYPNRAPFFRGELEHFLLFTRDEQRDPLALTGSYAGAMGLPQFMPSSYRSYAVDFDADGLTDIWTDPDDAIGSVANYLQRHGWERDGQVAVPAKATGDEIEGLIAADARPTLEVAQIEQAGVRPQAPVLAGAKVAVIALDTKDVREYWLGLNNFYVITRYNHSPLYAMAVYQLAEAIRYRYARQQAAVR